MIAPEHQALKLHDFYHGGNYELQGYDLLNRNKPIGTLTLADLSWCLRRRQFLEPVIEIIIDKIEDNQGVIVQGGNEISVWYHEVIKELITIPFHFWDNKHVVLSRYRESVARLFKWKPMVEEASMKLFLAYTPKTLYWTEEDGDDFVMDFYYDTLGNLLNAIQVITGLKCALLNGQGIFIVGEFKLVTTVQQLEDFIWEEYGHLEKPYGHLSALFREIGEIKKIKFIPRITSNLQVV
jgi:hypothetical protein